MIKKNIESILFISNKPLSTKQLADLVGKGKAEIETVLESLKREYNNSDRGIKIIEHNGKIQMATDSNSSEIVEKFLKQELTGEMTRPQLETVTIIAYRGPVTKMELEQIRGVNCSLILRNLLMRGLAESRLDKKIQTTVYNITTDFVRFLGLTNIQDLPDYERLSKHETIESILSRD
ncbi:SMC-Scp complex subunit ScpB [Candidatus Parcubacteria bacterium]|nr:SMC-Scp complex subunit ScpB [Candidatus Parcubacteria bacterium]